MPERENEIKREIPPPKSDKTRKESMRKCQARQRA